MPPDVERAVGVVPVAGGAEVGVADGTVDSPGSLEVGADDTGREVVGAPVMVVVLGAVVLGGWVALGAEVTVDDAGTVRVGLALVVRGSTMDAPGLMVTSPVDVGP